MTRHIDWRARRYWYKSGRYPLSNFSIPRLFSIRRTLEKAWVVPLMRALEPWNQIPISESSNVDPDRVLLNYPKLPKLICIYVESMDFHVCPVDSSAGSSVPTYGRFRIRQTYPLCCTVYSVSHMARRTFAR